MVGAPTAADIVSWTIEAGLSEAEVTPVVAGFVDRLTQVIPGVSRILVGLPTLHPTFASATWTWERGRPLEVEHQEASSADNEDWLLSPIYQVVSTGTKMLRANLTDPTDVARFPVFRSFVAAGHTDYLLRLVQFEPQSRASGIQGVIITFLSDSAAGFAPDDLAIIEQVLPAFCLAMFRLTVSDVARNLLSAYLGADAGRRVLSGKVRRGHVDRIRAAIFFADFRRFTNTSERMSVDAVIPWLNVGLSGIGDPIDRHGGQILKFLGDGLLAIFPVVGGDEEACGRALAAAREALSSLSGVHTEFPYEFDIALHIGEVGYGNIGTAERLDFTVIGPAVNEVSRMEKLCDDLGVHLLMSERFVECLGIPATDLGTHQLRGVLKPKRLLTLTEC